MAVKLRLRRMGKKKQPIYKIVAADARSPRDGKFLEAIGIYNPLTEPHSVDINEDRALYWLEAGAQPTETVRSLLRSQGISHKRELIKRKLSDDQVAVEMDKWKKMKEAAASVPKKRKKKKGAAEEKGTASA